MSTLGKQILVELFECDFDVLNNVDKIRQYMNKAVIKSGATVVDSAFHKFSPHGVSGTVVIAESHFAIHTWPEYGYAAVDLFTCGDEVDPWIAFNYLTEKFNSTEVKTLELERGHFNSQKNKIKIRQPELVESARA